MNDQPTKDSLEPISERYAKLWSSSEAPPDVFEFLNEHANAPVQDRAEVVLVDQVQRSLNDVASIASEVYLRQCPDLSSDHEVKLDIVYGELRSSQNLGRPIEHAALLRRFPELRVELTRQLEVAGWLRDEIGDADGTATRDVADEETLSFVLPASSERNADPQAPLSLDDFELKDVLGQGGMGTVFRATQISLSKTVAIKILRGSKDGEVGNIPRFLKEARAVAQLRHPNIVGVHGIGRDPNGRHFIVMDLVKGGSLRDWVKERSISVDEAIDLVADVAEAVEHAHRKGFLHRDLKPGNILLDESGTPMVTDFGLVKRMDTSDPSSVSIKGEIVGTPNYMAPEQADSRIGTVGPTADVYGLGGLLYFMLANRPPYDGDSILEVITQVVSDCPPRPLNKQRDDIPSEVEAICLKCLKRAPHERYQTAAELAAALRCLQATAVRTPSVADREQQRVSSLSRRSLAWLCAVVAIVVLGITVSLILRPDKPVPDGDAASPAALPPTNIKPVDVEWTVDAFLGGSQSDRIQLTELPSPLSNGDQVRIGVKFSRSTYAYLFWIGSDATVSSLYPHHLDDQEAITQLVVPEEADKGLPVFGPDGSELIVLVLSDQPLSEMRQLEDKLRPHDKPAGLPANSILVDGKMQTKTPSGKALAIIESRLDKGSRSVGMPTRLQDDPAAGWYNKWRESIPRELGDVHYLAIPHATFDEP